MKKKERQFSIPYPFKFIGLVMVVLVLVITAAINLLSIEIAPEQKELYKNGLVSFLLLGLFFNVMADEKVEDERSFYLKTKGLAGGFAGAIVYVILKPFINLIFGDTMEINGQEVALVMLCIYLITYYIKKATGEEA